MPAGSKPARHDGLPASLATAGVVGLLALSGVFSGPEHAALTARFELRGQRPLRAPVAIVAIDDAALAHYGQMPWSRKIFARLIDRLTALGAVAIGFDVAFVEPGRRAREEDQALASSIARSGRVVLAVYRPLQSGLSPAALLARPLPILASVSAGFGLAHFAMVPSFDIWRVEPEQHAGEALVPTLGLAVARVAQADSATARPGSAAGSSPWGTAPVALDFAGPAGSIPTCSVRDIMSGRVRSAAIAGHAVFVGAMAAGMPDTGFSAPFIGPMAGVEIHATACENFLSGRALRQFPPAVSAALWLLLALFPGPWLARSGGSPRARLGWLVGSLCAIVAGAWAGFLAGWLLPVAAPAVLVALGALVGILRQEGELLADRARLLGWYAAELTREAKRQREQIDGELHDEAQQLLVAMSRQVRRIRKRFDDAGLAAMESLTQRVLDEIIRVRRDLVPKTLAREGLVAAITEMALDVTDRGGPLVDVQVQSWPSSLDPLLESELYWLVKEALNNATKHANARRIEIALTRGADRLELAIRDDGEGFVPGPLDVPPETHEHTGLHRMWVRARGLGGNLVVRSAPHGGALLTFVVPARSRLQPDVRGRLDVRDRRSESPRPGQ